jgi:hypothetical protein
MVEEGVLPEPQAGYRFVLRSKDQYLIYQAPLGYLVVTD